MSADNILTIIEHDGKIRVFDINFSDISSHDDWCIGTDEAKASISSYIVKNYSKYQVWESDTLPAEGTKGRKKWATQAMQRAEGFCKTYCRNNIVEYDWEVIPEWSKA